MNRFCWCLNRHKRSLPCVCAVYAMLPIVGGDYAEAACGSTLSGFVISRMGEEAPCWLCCRLLSPKHFHFKQDYRKTCKPLKGANPRLMFAWRCVLQKMQAYHGCAQRLAIVLLVLTSCRGQEDERWGLLLQRLHWLLALNPLQALYSALLLWGSSVEGGGVPVPEGGSAGAPGWADSPKNIPVILRDESKLFLLVDWHWLWLGWFLTHYYKCNNDFRRGTDILRSGLSDLRHRWPKSPGKSLSAAQAERFPSQSSSFRPANRKMASEYKAYCYWCGQRYHAGAGTN